MADVTWWSRSRRFFAGYSHGVCTVLVGHSFDTIKVRMQSEGVKSSRFSNPLHCLKETMQKEGVRGLYKGMAAPLVLIGGLNFLTFGIQHNIVRAIAGWKTNESELPRRPTTIDHMQASLISGAIISLLATPKEGVKSRLQVQYDPATAKYKGPIDCVIKVTRKLGVRRGLYRGWFPTCLVQMSMWSYFGSYAFFCNRLAESTGVDLDAGEKLSIPVTLLAGGLAGWCFWLSCFPLDVIKNRMLSAPDVSPPVYRSFSHAAKHIYKTEGIRGFFAGFSPCMLRAFPANAAGFLGFEFALRLLPE